MPAHFCCLLLAKGSAHSEEGLRPAVDEMANLLLEMGWGWGGDVHMVGDDALSASRKGKNRKGRQTRALAEGGGREGGRKGSFS